MKDPFVGTWILNVEKSQFDANHRPQAGTLIYQLDAEGYFVKTAEGLSEKGEKVVERPERFLADGKEHPIKDFPGLRFQVTRTDPSSMTTEAKREDGSLVGGGKSVISADGKVLTVENFGYDAQLRQFKMHTVWDRQ